MKIRTLPVGQLEANCYLVWEETTHKGVIIDPGDEGGYLAEEVLREGIKLQAILATHAHFDHVMAAWELQTTFKIPFYLHQADRSILAYMPQSAAFWLKIKNEPAIPLPTIDQDLKEGQKIALGSDHLEVIHTPGHTPGSVCFYLPREKLVFSGDTLFANGDVGRTDLPGGSKEALQKSLAIIFELPEVTEVLPGHGEKTILRKEKKALGF